MIVSFPSSPLNQRPFAFAIPGCQRQKKSPKPCVHDTLALWRIPHRPSDPVTTQPARGQAGCPACLSRPFSCNSILRACSCQQLEKRETLLLAAKNRGFGGNKATASWRRSWTRQSQLSGSLEQRVRMAPRTAPGGLSPPCPAGRPGWRAAPRA